MDITTVGTGAERDAVQALFERTFSNLPGDAVPSDLANDTTKSLVAMATSDGALVGAALSCRPMFVNRWMAIRHAPVEMRNHYQATLGLDMRGFESAPDLVHDLDLLAVSEDHQRKGVGRGLLKFVVERLVEQGVHALIGHTTIDMGGPGAGAFYEKAGFTVMPKGRPLPKFGGRNYSAYFRSLPVDRRPVLSFYRILAPLPEGLPKAPVIPPKAKKQLREAARLPRHLP